MSFFNPRLLFTGKIDEIRSKAFAVFWSIAGRGIANDFPSPDLDNIINQYCHGDVLDIGPGSGFQLKRFRQALVTGQINRIYGVEPNEDMHDRLKAEAIKVFHGKAPTKYKILSCGAQPIELVPTLEREGLGNEAAFDTIVSLRALCGIPEPEETLRHFYRLLRPGGRIIFLEHVRNSGDSRDGGSLIAGFLQRVYMLLGWRFWNGGCELDRDTKNYLLAAAVPGWAHVDIHERNWDRAIPEIYGMVEKRK